MDRRRLIGSAVVLTTLGAAAALTLPSFADTTDQPAAAPTAQSEIVAAMRRDLSLTADQVRARLRTERWAAGTSERLSRELGDRYAGAWMNRTGDGLTVAVTDVALVNRVRATGATAMLVAHSGRLLDRVKRDLDSRAGAVGRGVPSWFVDAASNSVVVLARPSEAAAARRWAAKSGAPAGAVRIQLSNQRPVTLAEVRGGDAYFIDNRGRCSVGFSVQGGFVTAGHCGQPGSQTTAFDRSAQGTFRESSFPGDDFAFVETNAQSTLRPVVNTTTDGEVPVAGSQEAPVGAAVCRTGSTTGTFCGLIEAKDVTVTYPEGTVPGLTQTDVCAEPGDSGGSWISGDQAQGITSGGSGNCSIGGTTFFQPVNEALERLDLTLLTTGGGGSEPSPPPPAPVACDLDAGQTFRGSLSGTGARQIQPNGRFFRSAAGSRSACLDGPDGATFDLTLQRWNGRAWRTVATATGSSADKKINFNATAGFYRYRVQSRSGSGAYTLTF